MKIYNKALIYNCFLLSFYKRNHERLITFYQQSNNVFLRYKRKNNNETLKFLLCLIWEQSFRSKLLKNVSFALNLTAQMLPNKMDEKLLILFFN